MAILNSFVRGQLKGKIGTQSFQYSRSATGSPQTKVSSINTSPSNPRTNAQVVQRAKFAMAVKFYKRAVANFFRFAFEDKKKNESDYNAFMRHNIERCYIGKKTDVENPLFPAISRKWQLSCGTLRNVFPPDLTNTSYVSYAITSSNVGDISNFLIENNVAKVNDIITFIVIASQMAEDNIESYDDVTTQPLWFILQFIVDTSSNKQIEDLAYLGSSSDEYGNFSWSYDNGELRITPPAEYVSCWAACVHTRVARNKMLASETYLDMNLEASKLMNAMLVSGYYDAAVSSWQQGTEAILEGSVAAVSKFSVGSATVSTVNGVKIPYTSSSTLTGGYLSYTLRGSGLSSIKSTDFECTNCSVSAWNPNTGENWYPLVIKFSAGGAATVAINGQTIISETVSNPL